MAVRVGAGLAVAPVAPVFGAVEIDQLAVVAMQARVAVPVAPEPRGGHVPVTIGDQRFVVAEPAPRVAAAGMRAARAKLFRAEEGGLPLHEAPAFTRLIFAESVGTGGAGASYEQRQQPH